MGVLNPQIHIIMPPAPHKHAITMQGMESPAIVSNIVKIPKSIKEIPKSIYFIAFIALPSLSV